MNKIEVIPFHEEHLKRLRVREDLVKEEDALECFLNYNYADPYCKYFSMILGGQVIACGGLDMLREGVAQINMVTSEEVTHVAREFNQKSEEMLQILVKDMGVHRVEGYVRFDFRIGRWWARQMGFTSEGIMRQFGSDKADYYLFARLF